MNRNETNLITQWCSIPHDCDPDIILSDAFVP